MGVAKPTDPEMSVPEETVIFTDPRRGQSILRGTTWGSASQEGEGVRKQGPEAFLYLLPGRSGGRVIRLLIG